MFILVKNVKFGPKIGSVYILKCKNIESIFVIFILVVFVNLPGIECLFDFKIDNFAHTCHEI